MVSLWRMLAINFNTFVLNNFSNTQNSLFTLTASPAHRRQDTSGFGPERTCTNLTDPSHPTRELSNTKRHWRAIGARIRFARLGRRHSWISKRRGKMTISHFCYQRHQSTQNRRKQLAIVRGELKEQLHYLQPDARILVGRRQQVLQRTNRHFQRRLCIGRATLLEQVAPGGVLGAAHIPTFDALVQLTTQMRAQFVKNISFCRKMLVHQILEDGIVKMDIFRYKCLNTCKYKYNCL